jgi:hypothetical protein
MSRLPVQCAAQRTQAIRQFKQLSKSAASPFPIFVNILLNIIRLNFHPLELSTFDIQFIIYEVFPAFPFSL